MEFCYWRLFLYSLMTNMGEYGDEAWMRMQEGQDDMVMAGQPNQ